MIILAIDTAASLCAACVWDVAGARELGRAVRDIGKGHAEQLIGVIGEALAAAGKGYDDLGGIAVNAGPGSFTGIRVGVSTARGLALALGLPSTGVSVLDGLAEEARAAFPDRPVLVALDAGRDELHLAAYRADGERFAGPMATRLAQAAELAKAGAPVLAGSAARLLAQAAGMSADIAGIGATADIATYARLAVRRGFAGGRPRPLYLREADAKPQQGFVLPRKEG